MANRPNRAQSKKPAAKRPLLDDMMDAVIPQGKAAFFKRLLVLKVLKWLVVNGFMSKATSNRLKHPDGTPKYTPRRQKIARPMTADDQCVLDRLIDHAFPQNESMPNQSHYRTLVGLARNQGIAESTVQEYLYELVDARTARNIGLLNKD